MTDTDQPRPGDDLINTGDFDDPRRPLVRALRFGSVAVVVLTIASLMLWGALRDLPGIWGVVLGAAIGGGFILMTVVSVLATARTSATVTGVTVLGGWLIKMLVLVIVLAVLQDMDFFDRAAFGTTVIAVALVTLAVEAYGVITSRVTYVGPVPTGL